MACKTRLAKYTLNQLIIMEFARCVLILGTPKRVCGWVSLIWRYRQFLSARAWDKHLKNTIKLGKSGAVPMVCMYVVNPQKDKGSNVEGPALSMIFMCQHMR